ncbi:MAG: L-threonylcarbamoyladenylate synthase [Pseudomonas sp.]|uniref:L-threonylcarbamoyladenylate synthase n=1 Tax=Pseudomonas sp. TaxID=306 RepID=UPI002726666F|nr:L-threonylcarbamoyladenylate synthase [Pseudomonas sp.]MDO9616481.1 L-threonylcarbamoyladenylate synthase [Pseudomonas sp.]MDP2445623.1 L-threonylcarbamoyladenylate synthase [Pseudomonas sp.]
MAQAAGSFLFQAISISESPTCRPNAFGGCATLNTSTNFQTMPSITKDIALCAQYLRDGHLIAMPTETVYGLAADALQESAVNRVFALKGRPSTNPLIVHIHDAEQASQWAAEITPQTQRLMAAFWPGPLTLVLPARDEVLRCVTAGQNSVAIRVPAHPMAQQLLRSFGSGLVAPSANRYMSISPTSAEHVAKQFHDSELTVLDGGPCQVGLESSIVSLLPGDRPRLLRRGMISCMHLQQILGEQLEESAGGLRAPGQHLRHYAPTTPAQSFTQPPVDALDSHANGWIWCGHAHASQGPGINLGSDPEQYAAGFYAALYQLDALGLQRIYIQLPPHQEAWAAVHDRMTRACHSIA